MNQIRDGGGIKAKTLLGYSGDKASTGFKIGIVEFAIALVLLEVGSVRRCKERALVMIEPPGNLRRARVLEIDDSVFVTIKLFLIK